MPSSNLRVMTSNIWGLTRHERPVTGDGGALLAAEAGYWRRETLLDTLGDLQAAKATLLATLGNLQAAKVILLAATIYFNCADALNALTVQRPMICRQL